METLGSLLYGSHLWGTSTPESDQDWKIIYLPDLDDLLLNLKLEVQHQRFDSRNQPVGVGVPIGDKGYEAELLPVHRLVEDWMRGKTWAVEFVFGFIQTYKGTHDLRLLNLCQLLRTKYMHQSMHAMTGFAMKQTMDYVKRGDRLTSARRLLEVTTTLEAETSGTPHQVRLDTNYKSKGSILDEIAAQTGLRISEALNRGVKTRTLIFNARNYLETMKLRDLIRSIKAMVDGYGARSQKAAEVQVDPKSLMHAVRVYQQVIELFTYGFITFPRPNIEQLLSIKNCEMPAADVRTLIRNLDEQVGHLFEVTTRPRVSDEMLADAKQDLLGCLKQWYRK